MYHLVFCLYVVYLEQELDGEEVVGYDIISYVIFILYILRKNLMVKR